MHKTLLSYLERTCPPNADVVVEIGSRDVNGSVRGLFPQAKTYVGVDIVDGPGVDIVADAATWEPTVLADVVLCLEVLEHAKDWRAIVKTCAAACREGGVVIITAASYARRKHSADGSEEQIPDGEHYGAVLEADLRSAMAEAGLPFASVETVENGEDVRGFAVKTSLRRPEVRETFLSLCVIIKDGMRTLPAMWDSVQGMFDELVFVDTGSSDDTPSFLLDKIEQVTFYDSGTEDGDIAKGDLIKAFALHAPAPAEGHISAEGFTKDGTRMVVARYGWCGDFSMARNFSFNLAHGLWRMYVDHDDVIEYFGPEVSRTGRPLDLKGRDKPDLRKIVRRIAESNPETNAIGMPYLYLEDTSSHQAVRIVRWADGWFWQDPIHEVLVQVHGRRVITPLVDMRVRHDKTHEEFERSAQRNHEIIQAHLQRDDLPGEVQARLVYHHATDLMRLGRYGEADATYEFCEKTLEASTFWVYARRARVQMEVFAKNLDRALELAGGMWAHAPENRDGAEYSGWVLALKEQYGRAALAFDHAQNLPNVVWNIDEQWLSEGVFPAAYALALAKVGRIEEASAALKKVRPALRFHEFVHDLYVEADRLTMKVHALRTFMGTVDVLIADAQPQQAALLLTSAVPATIADLPDVQVRKRQIKRRLQHIWDPQDYIKTYAEIPAESYHGGASEALMTERAHSLVLWAEDLPKDGPPVHVLSIGAHDALIEREVLAKNERIHFTFAELAPQATESQERVRAEFPGRVTIHHARTPYDWGEGPFDAVVMFEVIEHVPSEEEALLRVSLAVKPGGWFFLSTPMADRWVESAMVNKDTARYGHVRAYTPHSLWALMRRNGFTGNLIEGRDATLVFEGQRVQRFGAEEEHPEVRIVVPHTPTPFDAVSPEDGFLGGSEEAVVRLSRALHEMDVTVRVYTPPKWRDGTRLWAWGGVFYAGVEEFDPGAPLENGAVLFWRSPQGLRQWRDIVTEHGDKLPDRSYLWLHDASYRASPADYEPAQKILTLSEHHRRSLIDMDGAPADKLVPFLNGIDEADFPALTEEGEAERQRYSLIYASSPERGLERILDAWDEIHERVPKAVLNIYYDWTLAKKLNPANIEKWKRRIAELEKKGVAYHGGIDQPTLHECFRKSDVWAYPTAGAVETFCITAVKAMAAGCRVVASTAGALPEIVERAGTLIPEGEWDLFTSAVIRTLLAEPTLEQRQKIRQHALRYTWKAAAERLLSIMEER